MREAALKALKRMSLAASSKPCSARADRFDSIWISLRAGGTRARTGLMLLPVHVAGPKVTASRSNISKRTPGRRAGLKSSTSRSAAIMVWLAEEPKVGVPGWCGISPFDVQRAPGTLFFSGCDLSGGQTASGSPQESDRGSPIHAFRLRPGGHTSYKTESAVRLTHLQPASRWFCQARPVPSTNNRAHAWTVAGALYEIELRTRISSRRRPGRQDRIGWVPSMSLPVLQPSRW